MVDNKQQWKAWLYLSPAIILLLVFTVWPIFNTVRMALLEGYNGARAIGGETFEFGFDNFVKVIKYRKFLTCLKNTMLLCVLTVPLSTLLALLIAVALNSIKFLQKGLQTIFFLPYVTNSIAIGMVFAAMFNIVGSFHGTENQIIVTAGIINNVIDFLNLMPFINFMIDVMNGLITAINFITYWTGLQWLFAQIDWDIVIGHMSHATWPINFINVGSSYGANITVLTVYIIWNALPFKILVLLGGLQSINKQYYDAAKVDGTPRRRVFTRITVPLLSPMLAYVVITGFIGGFKEYSSIVGIFGDTMGPAGDDGRLNTIVGYIYDRLPQDDLGRASAAALILFAIIMVVTMINTQVSKKRVHF